MNETPIVAVPASAISNFLKRPLAGDDFEISCLTVFPAEQSNSICFLANLGAVSRDMDPHFPDELVNRCPEMEIML
jgi:hypothetical protein